MSRPSPASGGEGNPWLGDAWWLLLIWLALPVGILAVGTPLALLARAILALLGG
ncbi:MAG: hypothetical protein AB7H88_16025 [Vicinamibacterales bacterium]